MFLIFFVVFPGASKWKPRGKRGRFEKRYTHSANGSKSSSSGWALPWNRLGEGRALPTEPFNFFGAIPADQAE